MATFKGSFDRQAKPVKPNTLIEVLVRDCQVAFSSTSICLFQYGLSTISARDPISPDFDYRWDLVRSGKFQRSRDKRESTKKWIAQQLFIDNEGGD